MASNTDAYFFKAENSTLTLEDIRNKGLIAGEASNGFIEVTFYDKLDYILEKLGRLKNAPDHHNHKEYWKLKQKELETFLMNSLKDGTPRLMRCASSSFGGCMDDMPVLIAYNPDGSIEKARDDYTGESKAEQLFFKEYNLPGYFDTVGFARYTTDHKTKEQKTQVELLEKEFEDQEYNKWKEKQSDLDIAKISLSAIKIARKGQSRFSYGSDDEYDNLDFMVRFIEEYYNIEKTDE